ncbi:hypothetical protein PENNAL_c0191G10076 [Penicillium nalgiovense]|uniref:Uncharacterized protein n=1 Tax=Penicillium nalgiovense TaxID=60175 RepID=A0A1V6WTB8_PENNA|nr:hypothetical protein PENNAL_c0191G10076 [Penicillium nalgiovense]
MRLMQKCGKDEGVVGVNDFGATANRFRCCAISVRYRDDRNNQVPEKCSPHSPAVASRSRAGCTGQVHKTAKARDEPTCDKTLYSVIGRPLRADSKRLRRSKITRQKSFAVGDGLLLQRHGNVSGVRVWGTNLAQIIGPGAARGSIFHSPYRGERTSGLCVLFLASDLGLQ